jgi:hypothetical protein
MLSMLTSFADYPFSPGQLPPTWPNRVFAIAEELYAAIIDAFSPLTAITPLRHIIFEYHWLSLSIRGFLFDSRFSFAFYFRVDISLQGWAFSSLSTFLPRVSRVSPPPAEIFSQLSSPFRFSSVYRHRRGPSILILRRHR